MYYHNMILSTTGFCDATEGTRRVTGVASQKPQFCNLPFTDKTKGFSLLHLLPFFLLHTLFKSIAFSIERKNMAMMCYSV